MEMYFCKGYDYREKVDLGKGYWNPNRKMWVTAHFSEIIKPGGGTRKNFDGSVPLGL